MADKNVKFTEEEVKTLKELQDSYLDVQNKFGQLAITKLNFQRQAEEIQKVENETKDKFSELQQEEQSIVSNLTEKYGQGSLDPSTGVFTPIEKT